MAANHRRVDPSWVERVNAALPPYRRMKPRDPHEARLLRERGTPEHLIGPEMTPADDQQQT